MHSNPEGFGFVHPSSGEGENVFLPKAEAMRALDGDLVEVLRVERHGRPAGRLVRVIERRRTLVLGTLVEQTSGAEVVPHDRGLAAKVAVARSALAHDGDLVKVALSTPGGILRPGERLSGVIAGSLGRPGHPSAEVLSIAYAKGFSDEFPAEVLRQADGISPNVQLDETTVAGRRDLRRLPLVTIDGADAKDFDDAVFAEERRGGFRLVVAIADVSHYVQESTPLDREALRRGTSVYLPDRVLPMLPERLSNGICSLVPDEDRLCLAADMQVERSGRVVACELYPAVMRSFARCTYEEVQAVLDGQGTSDRVRFRERFRALAGVAAALSKMRAARGSIDFDLPQTRTVLDDAGLPVRLEKRERRESHRLIEECMLVANEAVARLFQERRLPCIYRFHAEPDAQKLSTFAVLAQAHGFPLGRKGRVSPRDLNGFLEKIEGHPEAYALNHLLLRTMMQAVYSATDARHYGLGAAHYLHFTSPIRRYPDLIVHRLLRAAGFGREERGVRSAREPGGGQLERVAERSSERERAAMQVEREVTDYYSVLLMRDRLGEEFDATVTGVVDFGFFVELREEFVDGLVRAESLGGTFRFDARLSQLVYPSRGLRVRLGDRARVRLVSTNLARRQLEFELVSFLGDSRKIAAARPGQRGG